MEVGGVVGRAVAVNNDEIIVAIGGLDPRPYKHAAQRRRRAPRIARLAAGAARQPRNLLGHGRVAHGGAGAASRGCRQAISGAARRVGDALAVGGAAGEVVSAARRGWHSPRGDGGCMHSDASAAVK